MDSKTEKDWYELLTRVSNNLTPRAGLSTREMISDVLTATKRQTNEVGEWWVEGTAIAPMRLTINASSAFVLGFDRWLAWNKPTDEAWEVVQAPSFSAMLAKDPHAQAMIASRSSAQPYGLRFPDGVHVACRIETTEGTNFAAKDEIVMVTITGVPSAPVKLAMSVKAGENCTHVMIRAHEMAERHLVAVAQGKASVPAGPPQVVASAPQWNTGLGFRFDASASPDVFRKEYEGQWVTQGGTFRFAGRDYPYKSTSDENGARTFVSEMENERVDQLYAGPKVGMLVMDERTSVGVVEMLTATRAVMSTRRNAERVTLTFGAPKPAEKADGASFADYMDRQLKARVVKQSGHYVAWQGMTFDGSAPSKEALAAQGMVYGNRYASREDVALENQREMHRVANEHLAKAFTYPAYFGPVDERRAGVIAPRKPEPDPALVAKLAAEMSAAVFGPTHELDRVVERESANVPAKCDPVRWGNVVRVAAARYTEHHRKEREGVRDAQWWSSTAKVTAHEIEHVRPVIERYEAFRREGYSKVHSYQRALLKPGNETLATMRARDAYESVK